MKVPSKIKPPLQTPKKVMRAIIALIVLMKTHFLGRKKIIPIQLKNPGYNGLANPAPLIKGEDA